MEGPSFSFLDTILQTITRILTGGFLTVHPWVMTTLAGTISILLMLGIGFVVVYPQAISLVMAGQVIIRAAALTAIANNWLFLTDGFLNSVVYLGLRIGGSQITPEEFLAPGRIFFLGTAISTNLYTMMVDLGVDSWLASPIVFIAYTFAWFAIWGCFALMALHVMFAVVEFQLLSVFAFLMWPLMSLGFLSWIAESLTRFLLGAALRLAALAALMSIVMPFAVEVALPAGDVSVQSAMILAFGVIVLEVMIWKGPSIVGASAWPGTSLVKLGALSWAWMRRA